MKKTLFFLLFACLFNILKAQTNTITSSTEISILTIGPGPGIADGYGHNAYRIKDPIQGVDIVYDYGRFDFNAPNFILKFARGKLPYELGKTPFLPFLNHYKKQNRYVYEQVLDLNENEKTKIVKFLEINYLPENREYKYDFFFDNCATKMRDVLAATLQKNLKYNSKSLEESNNTFRDLIQQNLHYNTWISLGIDTALGAVIDTKASSWNHQFLPKYVHLVTNSATITKEGIQLPLVKKHNRLHQATEIIPTPDPFFISPLFVFSIISLLIMYITYKNYTSGNRSKWLDAIILSVTGTAGVFVFLLWFATDHTATANNYNLLWAMPLNLFIAFFIIKTNPKLWIRKYIVFLLLLMSLGIIHWISGVQVFAIALLPLWIALIVRYLFLIYFFNTNTNKTTN